MKLALVAVLLVAVAGCGASEPDAAPAPTARQSLAESAECRAGAGSIVAILEQAFADKDVRDVASRLLAIEEKGVAPTSTCTAAVAAPLREAVFSMNCAVDIAIQAVRPGDPMPSCPAKIGKAYSRAVQQLDEAKSALSRP